MSIGAGDSGQDVADEVGMKTTIHDPYAFPQLLTEYDMYLLNEGRHWQSYNRLGAHLRTIDGVEGVNFALWAPNATGVSIVGDFNHWDGRRHSDAQAHPQRLLGAFRARAERGHALQVPDPAPRGGLREVRSLRLRRRSAAAHGLEGRRSGSLPLARHATGSAKRRETNWHERPVACYEVHLGSWKRPGDDPSRWLTYRELAHQLVDYCKEMNYTHLELAAGERAPAHGQLGLPDGRLLRGHVAATARRTT